MNRQSYVVVSLWDTDACGIGREVVELYVLTTIDTEHTVIILHGESNLQYQGEWSYHIQKGLGLNLVLAHRS